MEERLLEGIRRLESVSKQFDQERKRYWIDHDDFHVLSELLQAGLGDLLIHECQVLFKMHEPSLLNVYRHYVTNRMKMSLKPKAVLA